MACRYDSEVETLWKRRGSQVLFCQAMQGGVAPMQPAFQSLVGSSSSGSCSGALNDERRRNERQHKAWELRPARTVDWAAAPAAISTPQPTVPPLPRHRSASSDLELRRNAAIPSPLPTVPPLPRHRSASSDLELRKAHHYQHQHRHRPSLLGMLVAGENPTARGGMATAPTARAATLRSINMPCAGLEGVVVLDPVFPPLYNTTLPNEDANHTAWSVPAHSRTHELATARCFFESERRSGSSFELPLSPGERVWILANSVLLDARWVVAKSAATGAVGLCPAACIERRFPPQHQMSKRFSRGPQQGGAAAKQQHGAELNPPSVGDEGIASAAKLLSAERLSWSEFEHLLSISRRHSRKLRVTQSRRRVRDVQRLNQSASPLPRVIMEL